MKRGDVWTAAGGSEYASKPRPVVIIQDDRFDTTASVAVCAFTTEPTAAPYFRLPVEPDNENGLERTSSLMVDKVAAVPRSRLGKHIGRLRNEDMTRLDRALVVFLGLA